MRFSLPVLICMLFYCCENGPAPIHKPTRAFYYWKSTLALGSPERSAMKDHDVKKIYIKLFDIVTDNPDGMQATNTPQAHPVAKLNAEAAGFQSLSESGIEIIPSIFITNQSFYRIDSLAAKNLALKTIRLYQSMLEIWAVPATDIKELQIDCDWTATTKDVYFAFLQECRSLLYQSGLSTMLTATIRLYQCKYPVRTGIPPVNRGLLMCYNMGNLRDPENKGNSIFDPEELAKYTSSLPSYPLPLDVAFPLFDWNVLIRQDRYAGLITGIPSGILEDRVLFVRDNQRYVLQKDTQISGYSLLKGDMLRVEESRYEDIISAAEKLKRKLNTEKFSISLYHLDSTILTKYTPDEIENIYNSLY